MGRTRCWFCRSKVSATKAQLLARRRRGTQIVCQYCGEPDLEIDEMPAIICRSKSRRQPWMRLRPGHLPRCQGEIGRWCGITIRYSDFQKASP